MKRLKKLLTYLGRRRDSDAGIISWATSAEGLGFNLFPRQRLVLKLIGAEEYYERDVAWAQGEPQYDEAADLAYLINSTDTHAAIWLPPSWKFDAATCKLTAPKRPLIALLIAGRRSGKTSIASIALAHRLIELSRKRHFPGVKLLRGQTIGAINVAADDKQARVLFERTAANLHIAGLVPAKYPSSGSIRIGRRVLYESLPTSAGAIRGRTAALCALDELAHFPGVTGPASADRVFDALLPSVRTFGRLGQIIITTSPMGRQGKVWELYECRGHMDELLVMQFATWEMHPYITRGMLQSEFELDPDMATCEYGAQFVAVDSAFLDAASVAACVRSAASSECVANRNMERHVHLDLAFARDRLAIAVGHRDEAIEHKIFIDEIIALEPSRGMPLDPSAVESAVGALAAKYRIQEVSFDQYCAPYLDRQLQKMGLRTRRIDFTSSSKMAIYTNLRVLIAGHMLSIPDNADLIAELTHLRRILRPGGFSVAAPTSGAVTTDDMADAVAALAFALAEQRGYDGTLIYQPAVF